MINFVWVLINIGFLMWVDEVIFLGLFFILWVGKTLSYAQINSNHMKVSSSSVYWAIVVELLEDAHTIIGLPTWPMCRNGYVMC